MCIKELNLEYGIPAAEDAIKMLKSCIDTCKKDKIGCLYIIHGYGSSGKGGKIRIKARQWLNAQIKNGKIKSVIYGEDFDIFNFNALRLKNQYKELEKFLNTCNHGITIVEL